MNEAQLIEQSQQGDSHAFGKLYEAYAQKIYGFLYHKTFNRSVAEDLTSETFLKALDKISRFDSGKAAFSTWLYTIARNTCIDFFRSHKNTESLEDAWELHSDSDVSWEIEIELLSDRVKECMQQLSAEQREILTMRYWQDMSFAEIAAALGKTEGSVKMSASRSVQKLRELSPSLNILLLLIFSL